MRRIIILLAAFLSVPLAAQTVTDMLYNKSYEFSNTGFNVDRSKPFTRFEEDVSFHWFQSGEGKLEALNDAVRALCRQYIDNEALFKSVTDEADRRMARYNEIWGYEVDDRSAMTRHAFTGLDVEVVSIAAGRVLYQAAFYFQFNSPDNYRDDERTTVRHYYLGNIATGSLTRWQPSISSKGVTAISNLIRDRFNHYYQTAGRTMAIQRIRKARGENVDIDKWMLERYHPPIADIMTKIELAAADIFWHKAGLIIQFQDYTAGSIPYKGEGYRVFFPYDEAIKIAAHIPDLAYVTKLPKPAHGFKAWDDTSLGRRWPLGVEPSPLNIAECIDGTKAVKMLTGTNNRITPAGDRHSVGRTVYQFDATGRLLTMENFDQSNQMIGGANHEYTADGRLKKTITIGRDGKESSSMIPEYDSKGNILRKISTSKEGVSEWYYFYNGKNVYSFYPDPLWGHSGHDWAIRLTPEGYCNNRACYETNEAGDITAVLSAPFDHYRMQIGRDKDGRLAEVHSDNERNHGYYDYDSQGRITQFSKYVDEKVEKIVMYEYGQGPYPNRIVTRTFSSGHGYSSEQVLEWSFYD